MKLLKMFNRFTSGILMTLAASSYVQAGVVTVWGDERESGRKILINDFYNSLTGHSSSIAADQYLNTVNLSTTNLLWVTQPADNYTAEELNTMASFIAAGGRIAFMGEHGGYSPNENLRINTALSFLGCTITIVNESPDGDFRTASVADGQILAHPLTTGVNTYEYACFAPLTISGTAQALMMGEDDPTNVMMGYQNIGAGSIFLITDQNVWDNAPTLWPGFNNARMFENLLSGNTAVNAPTTNPVVVTNLNLLTPTITWTYFDIEGDIQQEYEVEVWTGPLGTGTRMWDPPIGTGTVSSVVYAGSPLTASVVYYARVRASDALWGNFSETSFTLISTNVPPVADAGPDRTVSAGASCEASVTLDGSDSYDPDGGAIVSYTWQGADGPWTGATPAVTLPAGTHEIILKVVDNESTSDSDTVVITVIDDLAPVAPVLAEVRGECLVTLTAPTTTDNCDLAPITGTTDDSLIYTTPGTRTVRWTFTDGAGNSTTQTQTVVVRDETNPVPGAATLPDVTGECAVTVATVPTATDNCSGTITGTTTDSLVYTTPGTRTVTWTFTDAAGNSSTQTQKVIVSDVTAPVPDVAVLDVITGECAVTVSAIPTATDNCSGTINGTTTDALTYSAIGTHTLRWTFTDAAGYSTTQTQTVVVTDATAPVPALAALPDITGECSVTLTAPKADDNCAGEVTGTTADPTSYTSQGTFTVVWTYSDASGNSVTQNQTVIVHDETAPTLSARPDTAVYVSGTVTGATVTLPLPAANDACLSATVDGRRSDGRALDAEFPVGTTAVWWMACDANDNCDSTVQQVTVSRNRIPFIGVIADTTIDEGEMLLVRVTAGDTDGGVPVITAADLPPGAAFIDSGNGAALFSWDIGCSDNGVYTVTMRASDGIDAISAPLHITVRDLNFAPEFLPANDTATPENQRFDLTVRTADCDGDVPKIRAVSIPAGSAFLDNGDGTASFSWTPDCDDNSYYIMVFEATDGHVAVRDTILLRVTDVNCYDPQMTLSAVDVTVGKNLPLSIVVHATDQDGLPPGLEAAHLPSGALFNADEDGNAVLTWTPGFTGVFTPTITAIDMADPDVRIDTTVTITVTERNFTGPAFLPCSDTIIDENQLLSFTVTAEDPDGTIPLLRTIGLPAGATFTDDGNGSGVFSWQPECDMHGDHYFSAAASDGTYSDTITVLIVVRDQNCPPVINPIADKNIAAGSTLRFSVSAYDPDDDGTVPELSVACELPGYTFTLGENGSGAFEWTATPASGSYPVTFYANDGFCTDTETVTIAVDRTGSLHIVAKPSAAAIFTAPTIGNPGKYLGTGAVSYTQAPGTWWLRAQAPGYRPAIFTGTIAADEVCTVSVSLKPSIPLMVAAADTVRVGSADGITLAGSVAFVDFDADGIQDLSIAAGKALSIFPGSDREGGLQYRVPAISINVPDAIDSIVTHTYTDWDNDGSYECFISAKGGRLYIAEFDNEDLTAGTALLDRPGETLFPAVADLNGDNRKDLVVVAAGKGVFNYVNTGTDAAPVFGSPVTVAGGPGGSIDKLDGNPLLWDFDGDGWNDLVAASDGFLRLFTSGADTALQTLPDGEDLNVVGRRCVYGASSSALLMLPLKLPRLVTVSGGKAISCQLRLLGDITGDGTVNISDISKISKAWETTDRDDDWNPLYNLKLAAQGTDEVIDIKDISRAAKNWELEE